MRRRKALIKELEEFCCDLTIYKRLVEQASRGSSTNGENVQKETLHRKLLLQKGKLQPQIIGLVGRGYYQQFGALHDPWLEALHESAHTGYQLESLRQLIESTYEAIGKLQATEPSWVERTSLVYWAQTGLVWIGRLWRLANQHRVWAFVVTLAIFVAAIMTVVSNVRDLWRW